LRQTNSSTLIIITKKRARERERERERERIEVVGRKRDVVEAKK
jgi:hypothetical protein